MSKIILALISAVIISCGVKVTPIPLATTTVPAPAPVPPPPAPENTSSTATVSYTDKICAEEKIDGQEICVAQSNQNLKELFVKVGKDYYPGKLIYGSPHPPGSSLEFDAKPGMIDAEINFQYVLIDDQGYFDTGIKHGSLSYKTGRMVKKIVRVPVQEKDPDGKPMTYYVEEERQVAETATHRLIFNKVN